MTTEERGRAPLDALGGRDAILLVENDPSVRMLTRDALESFGYRVFEAPTAPAARQIWEARHASITLLLVDLLMPEGTSGVEFAEQLVASKPGLKVIYTSGYTYDAATQRLGVGPGRRLLQKPYTLQKLASTVRDCLDEAEGP